MCPDHRSNGLGRRPIAGDERIAERMTMSSHPQPVRIQRDERTVVVGVDGSEHSRMALKWAADEAARRGSLLRIICAFVKEPKNVPIWYEPGSFDLSPGEAIVDDAFGLVATRHPSLLERVDLADQPPAVALADASRSADLLVVGARGRGGFKELILGSVSDKCIQYAHCPVAVVRADPDELPLRVVRPRIVVGIDGSLGSTRALRWALGEAQIRSASVEAIYAWQYPPIGTFVLPPAHGYVIAGREIVQASTEYAERLAPDVPFEVNVQFAATVPALLDASEGADLLVTGSRGHGGFKDALLGSIAHQCTRHASCSVVVARSLVPDDDVSAKAPCISGAQRSTEGVRPRDSALHTPTGSSDHGMASHVGRGGAK
jgi:nucleotide-binding universal stress UspA family protein